VKSWVAPAAVTVSVDAAVVDRDDLVGAVLPHPLARPELGGADVALAGAPPQSVRIARDGLHLQAGHERVVGVEPGQPDELLAHDVGLELALRREGHVLEVAAAALAGTGEGARRLDAVRRRLEYGDGVRAPEPVALVALGDLDGDPLAGQGVPDEHHAGRGARHHVATVCDPPGHHVVALADVGTPARLSRSRLAPELVAGRPPPGRAHRPI
jgi:hypothetical protein